ncbi:hypothetical protein [Nitrosomonas aestuarii]|uniref:hypothetical protein n=1 Tax=Nitrosomonas aestuarii TaxID=52441 RepID=UPI000D325B55|nr:hypothetical protein [Nitrosomonas aestuarii]PTN11780.1 hypothetical protein C8R11_10765 [Nitrosomonas aestuarii]
MNPKDLHAIEVKRHTGAEPFHFSSNKTGFNLLSFWQWSSSDIVGNALRGIIAEYLVACAMGCESSVRTEWDACDIKTAEGIKIEVKSGAYIQSWHQKKLSPISFGIGQTYGWDAKENEFSTIQMRQADVYVFCVLAHKDKATIDPLNLDQWEFYCISASTINEKLGSQKSLRLGSLLKLDPIKTTYNNLQNVVNEIFQTC